MQYCLISPDTASVVVESSRSAATNTVSVELEVGELGFVLSFTSVSTRTDRSWFIASSEPRKISSAGGGSDSAQDVSANAAAIQPATVKRRIASRRPRS